MLLVTKLDNSVITETVTRGMAALLQSSVGVELRDAEMELFSIDYVPPYGVLDEGEGLILKSFYLRCVLLDSFDGWDALPWADAMA